MELRIEKLVYGGDGLARLPADEHGRGKAVFVPFVLEGERVEATLVEEKPGFARARLEQVLEPSPHRVKPPCPYFTRCGGCHYQHSTYEHQLQIKASILKENLRRIAKLELSKTQDPPTSLRSAQDDRAASSQTRGLPRSARDDREGDYAPDDRGSDSELQTELQIHPSPPWNYRNRTRMRVKAQPQFLLGYNQLGSHELEPVEQCPISSPLINRAIAAVWNFGRAGRMDPAVREIEFFSNADDTELLLAVYVDTAAAGSEAQPRSAARDKRPRTPAKRPDVSAAQSFAEHLRTALPAAAGVVVFPSGGRADDFKAPATSLATAGASFLQYATTGASYRVSAGSFFQVNRYLTDELVSIVTTGRSGKTALDLYAGVGLFSTVLARQFERVVAVESSQQSFADLAYNSPGNVKPHRAAVEQYLSRVDRKFRPDLVVVDPPRGGLGTKVARAVAELRAPWLTYVSCDPATLARDLVPLLAAGYRVEQVHLVDLFPQTFHLESVVQLKAAGT